jgi:hypothetical protein
LEQLQREPLRSGRIGGGFDETTILLLVVRHDPHFLEKPSERSVSRILDAVALVAIKVDDRTTVWRRPGQNFVNAACVRLTGPRRA